MGQATRYIPSGPGTEAAIEVEIEMSDGPVYLRIPFGTLAKIFGTPNDSSLEMFKTFIDRKFGIYDKIAVKALHLFVGEVYTVTPQDLS